MSYDHRMNPMYELWSYHDNGFIIDELCYIISSMTFIMTPTDTVGLFWSGQKQFNLAKWSDSMQWLNVQCNQCNANQHFIYALWDERIVTLGAGCTRECLASRIMKEADLGEYWCLILDVGIFWCFGRFWRILVFTPAELEVHADRSQSPSKSILLYDMLGYIVQQEHIRVEYSRLAGPSFSLHPWVYSIHSCISLPTASIYSKLSVRRVNPV